MDNHFIISLPPAYASLVAPLCCAKKVWLPCLFIPLSAQRRKEVERSSNRVSKLSAGLNNHRSLNAKKIKTTSDIFFGANRYRPANAHRVLILV